MCLSVYTVGVGTQWGNEFIRFTHYDSSGSLMAAAWLQTLLGMLILHPSCSLRILFTPLRC